VKEKGSLQNKPEVAAIPVFADCFGGFDGIILMTF
jgi:hypothetical protein